MPSNDDLKIANRSIFIKHPNKILAIFTVKKKIYGFSYDNEQIHTTQVRYDDSNPEKAIQDYIFETTKNNENYNNQAIYNEISTKRTEYIIKELKIAIANNRSHGHLDEANTLEKEIIISILEEHNLPNPFKAEINPIYIKYPPEKRMEIGLLAVNKKLYGLDYNLMGGFIAPTKLTDNTNSENCEKEIKNYIPNSFKDKEKIAKYFMKKLKKAIKNGNNGDLDKIKEYDIETDTIISILEEQGLPNPFEKNTKDNKKISGTQKALQLAEINNDKNLSPPENPNFIEHGNIAILTSDNQRFGFNYEKDGQILFNEINKDSQPFNNLILKHLENINKRYTSISTGTPYSTRIRELKVAPVSKYTYYNLVELRLCSRDELTSNVHHSENNNGTLRKKVEKLKKIPVFQIVEEEYNELSDLDTTDYIRFNNGILNTNKGTFEKELLPDLKIKMKTIGVEYKEDNETLENLWNIFGKNFKDKYQFKLMLADITHLRIDDIGWAIISTFGTGKDFILEFLGQLAPVEVIPGVTFNEDSPRFSKNLINKNTFAINEANTLNKSNQLIDIISGNKYGFNIKHGDYYIAKNPKLLLFGNSLKPSISNNNQLSEKLIYCDMNQHNFRKDTDKLDRHRDWSKEIGAFYYWLFNKADIGKMKKDILELATKTRDEGTRAVNIDDLLGEYYEIDNSSKFVDDIDTYETILYDDFRADINKIIEKHNIGEKFENNRSGNIKIGYLLKRFFNEVLSNRKGFIYTDNKYSTDGIKEIQYKQRRTIKGEQKNVLVGIKKIKEI